MTAGIQVRNENGELVVDLTTNTTRILGNFDTTTSNGSKTVAVPSGKSLWFVVNYLNNTLDLTNNWQIPVMPIVTASENVISWTFNRNTDYKKMFENTSLYVYVDAPEMINIGVNILYGVR